MKIMASDPDQGVVLVHMEENEWRALQEASGLSYAARGAKPSASLEVGNIREGVRALQRLHGMLGTMTKCLNEWQTIIEAVDRVSQTEAQDHA